MLTAIVTCGALVVVVLLAVAYHDHQERIAKQRAQQAFLDGLRRGRDK